MTAIDTETAPAYTPGIVGGKVKTTASLEKYDLMRRYVAGEVKSNQVVNRFISIDSKPNRTSLFLGSVTGLLVILLAPFLPGHSNGRTSS